MLVQGAIPKIKLIGKCPEPKNLILNVNRKYKSKIGEIFSPIFLY
jgi:hypothetical protein